MPRINKFSYFIFLNYQFFIRWPIYIVIFSVAFNSPRKIDRSTHTHTPSDTEPINFVHFNFDYILIRKSIYNSTIFSFSMGNTNCDSCWKRAQTRVFFYYYVFIGNAFWMQKWTQKTHCHVWYTHGTSHAEI